MVALSFLVFDLGMSGGAIPEGASCGGDEDGRFCLMVLRSESASLAGRLRSRIVEHRTGPTWCVVVVAGERRCCCCSKVVSKVNKSSNQVFSLRHR